MQIIDKKLLYFLQCAESKSLLTASKKLRISQPALSKAIQTLEEDAGFTVFERTVRGVELTQEGFKLYETCRSVLEFTKTQGSPQTPAAPAPIRMGSVFHFASRVIAPLHSELKEQAPGLLIYSLYSYDCMRGVQSGELDFAFIAWTKKPIGVATVQVAKDPFFLLGQRKRFAHIEKAKSVRELKNDPWFFHSKPQATWSEIPDNLRIEFLLRDMSSLRSIVLKGLAIGDAHLNLFSDDEIQEIVWSRKIPTYYGGPQIYLIHRENLKPELVEAKRRILALVKEKKERHWIE